VVLLELTEDVDICSRAVTAAALLLMLGADSTLPVVHLGHVIFRIYVPEAAA